MLYHRYWALFINISKYIINIIYIYIYSPSHHYQYSFFFLLFIQKLKDNNRIYKINKQKPTPNLEFHVIDLQVCIFNYV